VILFDGVCNLCNGGVNLALDLDPPGELRFAALQSSAGRALLRRSGRDASDISSIVLVERDRSYVKSGA
jgi:predicted DCC family thiol-disulfide oxidoreductase YuxK